MINGRRVFDAFLFGNELDLLELRLLETEDVVDHWILAESSRTHSGLPKPLVYADNRERFARWRDRIIYQHVSLPQDTNEGRENSHRRLLGGFVDDLNPGENDIVHTSDLDEIPAEAALKRYASDCSGIMGVEARHSYYFLNCWFGGWGAGRIGTWGAITDEVGTDFQKLRHIGHDVPMLRAKEGMPESGGWHLSFMGGVEQIQKKLHWYLHSDAAIAPVLDPRWLQMCISTGASLFMAKHADQDHWFRFGEPNILPKALLTTNKFDWLLAHGVKFNYEKSSTDIRKLWQAACRVQKMNGAVVDMWATDGLTTAAMAAAVWPKQVQAYGDWTPEEFIQFERNVKAVTKGNVTSLPRRDFPWKDRNERICFVRARTEADIEIARPLLMPAAGVYPE